MSARLMFSSIVFPPARYHDASRAASPLSTSFFISVGQSERFSSFRMSKRDVAARNDDRDGAPPSVLYRNKLHHHNLRKNFRFAP